MRDPVKPKGTRTGFTTGACAAAAARAAAAGLVNGTMADAVECLLPNGKRVRFAVAESHLETAYARAVIIKDAGDDPDRTHGAHLTAEVRLLPEAPGAVRLKGGAGVGTVTQPGLGLEVGTPAINPVPRRNIEENVREVAALTELGHITKAQVEQMYVDDIPPTQWRLACQMIVRDEDILVEYPSK